MSIIHKHNGQHYSAYLIVNFNRIRTFTLYYLAMPHLCISWVYKEPSAHAPIPIWVKRWERGGGAFSPSEVWELVIQMYIVFAGPKYGKAVVNFNVTREKGGLADNYSYLRNKMKSWALLSSNLPSVFDRSYLSQSREAARWLIWSVNDTR